MRILITGASGFIGAALTKYTSSEGHEVIALCRSGKVDGWKGRVAKWELGQPIPEEVTLGIDCAIHLAHDFSGVDGAQVTLAGTLQVVHQLIRAGAMRQVFFSSYSAGEHAVSLYGRTKLEIERELCGLSVTIVRPGLVLGNGGIYGRIQHWVQCFPVIPLPRGGRGLVPVISLSRLCIETVAIACGTEILHEANLFEKQLCSLRQLVERAASEAGRKPIIISVPVFLIRLALWLASLLRISLPINSDNLAGFIANQAAHHDSSLKD